MAPTAQPNPRTITGRNIAVAAAAAAAVDLVVYAAASAAGATWEASAPSPVSPVAVVVFSVVPLVAAALVVAAIARKKPGFQRFAHWFCLAFAIVTVAAPVLAAPQFLTAASLGLMHLVVGGAWYWLSHPGRRTA
ncbi:DUF6069 family protein [Thermobifida cellulosilytica]|uniref:Uncharacterized protein n=1 Tax=Thermobifida cellulosilytica TB100 TaxID=665004 RepID=A0A147KFC7_THECS|nr:DUF6069 family protein [Thermobifida cellulosilytica]KUP95939.1 hypothetical protein AC529_14790 [Thermobifida cellulosilytica TB100]